MLPFCIDRCVLGTDRHFVYDGAAFGWEATVPAGAWHLSGDLTGDWSLDALAKLAGKPIDCRVPEPFINALSQLTGSLPATLVPWQKVVPVRAHQSFAKRLAAECAAAMEPQAVEYFEGSWRAASTVLRALQPVKVNAERWQELVARGEGNVPALKSFCPGKDGFAAPVVYDRFATYTGRLTVASGPQILTLKREHRDVMVSRWGAEGCIVSLDFAALEARVLLYEYGRTCDSDDLYGSIAQEMGLERKAIKYAVISELYGRSKHALGEDLGLKGRELTAFTKRIKSHFRTDELLKRVKAQFIAKGFLENRYGRRVHVDEPLDNILISYYAQSTGVDVTMMGFAQAVSQLQAARAVPVFVLHDAILVDVHLEDVPKLQQINRVKVSGYVQPWPLRFERVV